MGPSGTEDVRPIRSETRTTLVRSIALGRRWLQEVVDGSAADPDEIAVREGCSKLTALGHRAPVKRPCL